MQPTTGWYSAHDCVDCLFDDAIYVYPEPEDDGDGDGDGDFYDECEPDAILVGDWLEDGDDYTPDKDGEFAGVYSNDDNTIAIVWSKTVRYGHLGSPCIPGQVYASADDPTTPPDGAEVQTATPGMLTPAQMWRDDGVYAYYGLPDDCIRRDDD